MSMRISNWYIAVVITTVFIVANNLFQFFDYFLYVVLLSIAIYAVIALCSNPNIYPFVATVLASADDINK